MAEPATAPTPSTKIPINFELDGKLIDAASIRPASFAGFAGAISAAHQMTVPPAFSARLLRQRMSQ
jgi:hypothetical protein